MDKKKSRIVNTIYWIFMALWSIACICVLGVFLDKFYCFLKDYQQSYDETRPKLMMDEIFGMQNFKGMITRKKCKSKNFTRKTYGNISDFILFYTKTEEPVWNRPYEAWDDEKILKEYPYIEEGTGRRYKKVPVHAPGTRNGATGMPWRGMMPPEGKHWQFTPDKLDEMDANGEIYWSGNL